MMTTEKTIVFENLGELRHYVENTQAKDAKWYSVTVHERPKNFEIGKRYQWMPGLAWSNQGLRHGPLTCVYVGKHQGGFASGPIEYGEDAGMFENRNGLHIIATAHLRSGDFVELD